MKKSPAKPSARSADREPHPRSPRAPRAHREIAAIEASNRAPRALLGCAAFFVAAITFLAFRPALDGGWLDWDDLPLLYENTRWRGFSGEHVSWMFTTFHMGPYQPLSWLSYALDHALWGMDPRGYHLTNVVLHAATAVWVYFLARALFAIALSASELSSSTRRMSSERDERSDRVRSRDGASSARSSLAVTDLPLSRTSIEIAAALTALAWSIHPLRVESVAWITERRDCLSGLFFVLTLLAWLAHVESAEPRVRARWFRLAVAAFAASVLAKGLVLVLPFVLLVLDVWPLRRAFADSGAAPRRASERIVRRARELVVEKWPFWILSLCAAVLAVVGQRSAGAIVEAERHGWSARIAQAFYGLAFYVRKSLWPSDLMVLHPIAVPFPLDGVRFVASEIAVVIALVLLVLGRRRIPAIAAAALCYALIAAPVLGFVQTGSQLVASRYSYLASLPLTLLAGGACLLAARRASDSIAFARDARGSMLVARAWFPLARRWMPLALGGALLVPLGLSTAHQCRVWHDTFSLWRHDLAIDPFDNAARRNLIVAYLDQGRGATDAALRASSFASALEECRLGSEQSPDAAYCSNAAKVYDLMADDDPSQRARNLALALEHARRGVEIVEHSNQRYPPIYETCGVILCKLERASEAVPCFEKLIAADATQANHHALLAGALLECGRAREAVAPLEAALRIEPENAAIWLELGDVRRRLGDNARAIEAYRRVIELAQRASSASDADAALARQAIAELDAQR